MPVECVEKLLEGFTEEFPGGILGVSPEKSPGEIPGGLSDDDYLEESLDKFFTIEMLLLDNVL